MHSGSVGVKPHEIMRILKFINLFSDCTVEQKECVEGVLAEILKNILASASSGDTVLTAKPRNIIQQPN